MSRANSRASILLWASAKARRGGGGEEEDAIHDLPASDRFRHSVDGATVPLDGVLHLLDPRPEEVVLFRDLLGRQLAPLPV